MKVSKDSTKLISSLSEAPTILPKILARKGLFTIHTPRVLSPAGSRIQSGEGDSPLSSIHWTRCYPEPWRIPLLSGVNDGKRDLELELEGCSFTTKRMSAIDADYASLLFCVRRKSNTVSSFQKTARPSKLDSSSNTHTHTHTYFPNPKIYKHNI